MLRKIFCDCERSFLGMIIVGAYRIRPRRHHKQALCIRVAQGRMRYAPTIHFIQFVGRSYYFSFTSVTWDFASPRLKSTPTESP